MLWWGKSGGTVSLSPLTLLQPLGPILQKHLIESSVLGLMPLPVAQKVLKSLFCSRACCVASGCAVGLDHTFPFTSGWHLIDEAAEVGIRELVAKIEDFFLSQSYSSGLWICLSIRSKNPSRKWEVGLLGAFATHRTAATWSVKWHLSPHLPPCPLLCSPSQHWLTPDMLT